MNVDIRSLHTYCKAKDYQGHTVDAGEAGIKDKEQKVFVIANPNTIVHPWAMVIHFNNTTSTYTGIDQYGGYVRCDIRHGTVDPQKGDYNKTDPS